MTAQISAYGRLVADPQIWLNTVKATLSAWRAICSSISGLVRMAAPYRVIRYWQTVCSAPERYAPAARWGNRGKLLMPYAVRTSNTHQRPIMRILTRRRRLMMGSDIRARWSEVIYLCSGEKSAQAILYCHVRKDIGRCSLANWSG